MDRGVYFRAVQKFEFYLVLKYDGGIFMKSLAELAAIREKMQSKVVIREGMGTVRVVVGMATCGIAAGARPVLKAFTEGVNAQGLTDKVSVTQTGCIGICQYEPVVEIFEEGKEKVTYVKLDAEKAAKIVEEHLKGGNPVAEYTIGNANL
jgi:NADP-reducing hydrogenase subunit HndB